MLPVGVHIDKGAVVLHAMHTLSSAAPVDEEYLPKPQFVHADLPVVVTYLPPGHKRHASVPVIALYFPVAQFTQLGYIPVVPAGH